MASIGTLMLHMMFNIFNAIYVIRYYEAVQVSIFASLESVLQWSALFFSIHCSNSGRRLERNEPFRNDSHQPSEKSCLAADPNQRPRDHIHRLPFITFLSNSQEFSSLLNEPRIQATILPVYTNPGPVFTKQS